MQMAEAFKPRTCLGFRMVLRLLSVDVPSEVGAVGVMDGFAMQNLGTSLGSGWSREVAVESLRGLAE